MPNDRTLLYVATAVGIVFCIARGSFALGMLGWMCGLYLAFMCMNRKGF